MIKIKMFTNILQWGKEFHLFFKNIFEILSIMLNYVFKKEVELEVR